MKIIQIISFLLFISALSPQCKADDDINISVRRGDTWKSIATKYGIAPDDLRKANNNLAECMIGMNIIIPGPLLEEARKQREEEEREARAQQLVRQYEQASNYFEQGKYKDAVKVCDRILSTSDDIDTYYLRGLSQYNREKWGKAIDDLSYVVRFGKPGSAINNHSLELLEKARQLKQESDENKAQLIGGLLAVGATVATAAVIASNTSKSNKKSSSNASSGNSSRPIASTSSSNRKKANSSRRYTPSKSYSSSTTSNLTQGEIEANRLMAESEAKFNEDMTIAKKYFDPATFVANYQAGRNTMPSAKEMGLTGLDAHAYEVQRSLQHRSQIMNLQMQQMTDEHIQKGNEMAQEEINNFSKIYGREPTAEEISAIYSKYTQGYVDSYTDYVKALDETHKELGLGEIERTVVHTENKEGVTVTTVGTKGESDQSTGNSTTTENNLSVKSAEAANTKDSGNKNDTKDKGNKDTKDRKTNQPNKTDNASESGYEYKQVQVNLYEPSKHKFPTIKYCKIFQKGSNFYVEIHGSKYQMKKSNKPGFNRVVIYNNGEYYFNY